MEAKLVVVGGEAKAAEIDLKLPTVIGRGREAKLTLPHPLVSRLHCEIYEADGQLVVKDLESLNGTFIGNERITGTAVLPAGELLTIGTVTFRAVYQQNPDLLPPGEKVDPSDETIRSSTAGTVEADDEFDFEDVEEVEEDEELPAALEDDDEELEAELDDEEFDDEFDDDEDFAEVEDFESGSGLEVEDESASKQKVAIPDPGEKIEVGNSGDDANEDDDEDDDDLQAFLKELG